MNETEQREALIRRAYAAFNARDIDAALATMQPDVEWPASTEGSGYVHGHDEIRAYWTRQWGMIDPHVDPVGMTTGADGRIAVEVRQVVHDRDGALRMDVVLQHVYRFEGKLIAHMEIIA